MEIDVNSSHLEIILIDKTPNLHAKVFEKFFNINETYSATIERYDHPEEALKNMSNYAKPVVLTGVVGNGAGSILFGETLWVESFEGLVKKIKEDNPESVVIGFSTGNEERVMRSGADGYVEKEGSYSVMMDNIIYIVEETRLKSTTLKNEI